MFNLPISFAHPQQVKVEPSIVEPICRIFESLQPLWQLHAGRHGYNIEYLNNRMLYAPIGRNGFLEHLHFIDTSTLHIIDGASVAPHVRILWDASDDADGQQWADMNASLIGTLLECINACLENSGVRSLLLSTEDPTRFWITVDFYGDRDHETFGWHQDGLATQDVLFFFLLYAMKGPVAGPEWVSSLTDLEPYGESVRGPYPELRIDYAMQGVKKCPQDIQDAVKSTLTYLLDQKQPYRIYQAQLHGSYPALLACDPLIFHCTPYAPSRQLAPWMWAAGLLFMIWTYEYISKAEKGDRGTKILFTAAAAALDSTRAWHIVEAVLQATGRMSPERSLDREFINNLGFRNTSEISALDFVLSLIIQYRAYETAKKVFAKEYGGKSAAEAMIALGEEGAVSVLTYTPTVYTSIQTRTGVPLNLTLTAARRGMQYQFGRKGLKSSDPTRNMRDMVFHKFTPDRELPRDLSQERRKADISQPDSLRFPEISQPDSLRFPEISQPDSLRFPEISQPDSLRFPEISQPDSLRSPEISQPDSLRSPEISQPDSLRSPNILTKSLPESRKFVRVHLRAPHKSIVVLLRKNLAEKSIKR